MTRPPNKELKLTKPGTIGASQLNSSVRQTLSYVQQSRERTMGKRDGFWDSVPDAGNGEITWPEDPASRASLVQAVFGAKVVGAMDAIVEGSLEIASGKRPQPGSHDYEKEAAFRDVFLKMTDQQREAVQRLVRDTASGTLYWILVKLNNFPSGTVRLAVEPWGPNGGPLPVCQVNEHEELHQLYLDWIERFSDHIALPT